MIYDFSLLNFMEFSIAQFLTYRIALVSYGFDSVNIVMSSAYAAVKIFRLSSLSISVS